MGMSPSGILFYGIWYTQEEVDEGVDWSEKAENIFLAHRDNECPMPEKDYDLERGRRDSKYESPWIAWRKQVVEWDKEQCMLDYAGHCDFDGNLYIYVVGSRKEADWDEMVPVRNLVHQWSSWDGKLKKFAEELGLPWKEPGWYLTSRYI